MNIDEKVALITEKITAAAADRRKNAGLSGSWGDDGAGEMERRLEAWLDGIQFAKTGNSRLYGYIIEQADRDANPEYQEYLRLKAKFGSGD